MESKQLTNGKWSMFDSKGRVRPRGIQIDFFEMLYCRKPWAGGEFVLESLDALQRPFSHCFNSPIVEILHITNDLVTRSGALRKKAKTDALYVSGKKKLARDF